MGSGLEARLRRIKEMGGRKERSSSLPPADLSPLPAIRGWSSLPGRVLKRDLVSALRDFPREFPRAADILIPDFARYAALAGRPPLPSDLLFFDLETTGLSGGAGTVAFLAAFARVVPGGDLLSPAEKSPVLSVRQYLLLDYPGEADFLPALLEEFRSGEKPPLVVSYNGKSFDMQILRTRCLMNGIVPPSLCQADLLHPSRRLWRGTLDGCSQGEIEGAVLGIDRSGDTPGEMAPDIWFHFLKTGETRALEGICDHNFRDVRGLASIFSVLVRIARDPEGAGKYRADPEQLALLWRRAVKRDGPSCPDGALPPLVSLTAARLLDAAAGQGCPHALYLRSCDLFARGRGEEGRALLSRLASGKYGKRARLPALRMLAVDAEWRLKDAGKALSFTVEALASADMPGGFRAEMEKRLKRLREKAETGG
ncbi:MAG: ribonuclease H-like domain-containing protein [Treponema sp.]|jgi:uncharacterized protein YprB with RNaseH-like and TPR domain|nr:ribonuclease H-like domain-containing protein [Treponema sp.]